MANFDPTRAVQKTLGRSVIFRGVLFQPDDGGRVCAVLGHGKGIKYISVQLVSPTNKVVASVEQRFSDYAKLYAAWDALGGTDDYTPTAFHVAVAAEAWGPGINHYLSAIGRSGGHARSEAKVAAARTNGKRGGRPRKSTSME